MHPPHKVSNATKTDPSGTEGKEIKAETERAIVEVTQKIKKVLGKFKEHVTKQIFSQIKQMICKSTKDTLTHTRTHTSHLVVLKTCKYEYLT